jgi:hypothetical protein
MIYNACPVPRTNKVSSCGTVEDVEIKEQHQRSTQIQVVSTLVQATYCRHCTQDVVVVLIESDSKIVSRRHEHSSLLECVVLNSVQRGEGKRLSYQKVL